MVNNKKEHSDKKAARQGAAEVIAGPNKIGASTPYDFEGRNLTAYGGLLPRWRPCWRSWDSNNS